MAITAASFLPILSFFLSLFLAVPIASAQTFNAAAVYTESHFAGVWAKGYLNGPREGSMLDTIGMTMDAAGNTYITGGARIRVIDLNGRVWNLAGTGIRGYKDGPAESAMFNTGAYGYLYEQLAMTSSGVLLLADGANNVIRSIYQNNGRWMVGTYAGNGGTSLIAGQRGTIGSGPGNVKFVACATVTVDSSDNVWVGAMGKIYKIDPSGKVWCYLTSPNSVPVKLRADGVGNVYMYTRDPLSAFYKISPDGTVTFISGQNPSQLSPVDGPASVATYWMLADFVVTSDGNTLYGGNGDEYGLRRINGGAAGNTTSLHRNVTTLKSDGWYTDSSRAAAWLLGGPIHIGANGTIYLFTGNAPTQLMIRKLVPTP